MKTLEQEQSDVIEKQDDLIFSTFIERLKEAGRTNQQIRDYPPELLREAYEGYKQGISDYNFLKSFA